MKDWASVLFAIAVLLFVAEWGTRESPATLRWGPYPPSARAGLVALLWLEFLGMAAWVWWQ